MPDWSKIKVPAEGPLDAKIVLVGEGPGMEEVRGERPFIGTAGRELDALLGAAGIKREEVFITNITKTLPVGRVQHAGGSGDEKRDFFFNAQTGTPTHAYMQGILEVAKEIQTIRKNGGANVVVAIGNYAMWALTQKEGITKWRGSVIPSTLMKGLKVIPIIHPAWLYHTRQFQKRPLLEWDLCKVKRHSESPKWIDPRRLAKFNVDPTPNQLQEAIDRLLSGTHITYDTEWYSPEEIAYIGFTNSNNWGIVLSNERMSYRRVWKVLLESEIEKWGQNLQFDVPACARVTGIIACNVKHDTMIAFHNCWPDLGEKKLSPTLSSIFTDVPFYKEELEFIGKDETKGKEYCATDCIVTDQACEEMVKPDGELDYSGGRRGYEIHMGIFDIFTRSSIKGLRADTEWIKHRKRWLLRKANKIEDLISSQVGFTVNCRSNPQVAHLVYDVLGLSKTRKKRTVAQDVLMDIAASSHDPKMKSLLTAIIRVRQNRNEVSRYIDPKVVDIDGRLKTNWNLAGTRSGRLSTSNPWWAGLAWMTIPDTSRRMVIADEGMTFLGWDLDAAEARVVAALCGDLDLLQDLDNKVDIHTKLAAMLPFGMTYDELVAKVKKLGKDQTPERYIAKKGRHSLNYVGTWHTLKNTVNREYLDTGIGLDAATSKKVVSAYYDIHPFLEDWWESVYRILRSTHRLSNVHGRIRHFLGTMDDHLKREAVSFEPQSTIADCTSISIARLDARLKKEIGPECQVFIHMHDGGLAQVPSEAEAEAAAIMKEETQWNLRVNGVDLFIPSEVKSGWNWGELKYIKAT